jgi:hypothetical protein
MRLAMKHYFIIAGKRVINSDLKENKIDNFLLYSPSGKTGRHEENKDLQR